MQTDKSITGKDSAGFISRQLRLLYLFICEWKRNVTGPDENIDIKMEIFLKKFKFSLPIFEESDIIRI